jgi:hypothetical protein
MCCIAVCIEAELELVQCGAHIHPLLRVCSSLVKRKMCLALNF